MAVVDRTSSYLFYHLRKLSSRHDSLKLYTGKELPVNDILVRQEPSVYRNDASRSSGFWQGQFRKATLWFRQRVQSRGRQRSQM